jgi:hypothetical protein
MSDRELNMREFAVKAESEMQQLMQKLIRECPEIVDQVSKSNAIGDLADVCGNLFYDAIKDATESDMEIQQSRVLKHGMNYQARAEGRAV